MELSFVGGPSSPDFLGLHAPVGADRASAGDRTMAPAPGHGVPAPRDARPARAARTVWIPAAADILDV